MQAPEEAQHGVTRNPIAVGSILRREAREMIANGRRVTTKGG